MSEILILILTFGIGIIASFFSATVGGSAMISIPALIFLGLPPQIAVATDRLGGFGSQATSLLRFWKEEQIVWKYVPSLIILSLVSSFVGANILLAIDSHILQKMVGLILLICLPFIFFSKQIGFEQNKISNLRKIVGYFIFFVLQTLNTFLPGMGIIMFYNLVITFKLSMIQASATRIIPLSTMAVTSFLVFAFNGIVNYKVGLILLLGMSIGGYIGAHLALKKGNLWLKNLFAIVVIISSLKLLFS